MKKILGIFIMLAVLVFACKKQEPMPAHVEEIYFEQNVPTKLDEGDDINLSSYLVILPESVSDKVTVEWSSSDPEIATVSENGTVQTLRMGDVTITAKAMDHTASVDLEVEKVRIKEFNIPATFQVYVGSKAKFPITDVSPKGTPLYRFKWEADNDGKKPTYSEGSWYLKADEEREYTLTASVDDAEDAKCQVKFVEPSVSKLAFSPTSFTVEQSASLSLKSKLQITAADGFKADTVKVVWSSNKTSVATIDANGNVKALAVGKATITAAAGGKSTTCSVTVTAKPDADPSEPADPSNPSNPSDPSSPTDPSNPSEPTNPDEPVVKKYTVSYNANGGIGSMSSVSVDENQSVTIAQNTFTRSGYEFTSWNTKANGSGTTYKAGDKLVVTADVTLYAQWNDGANGHEYVDLGLSVKWATNNVGASSSIARGDYYAWGETETKSTYASNNYYIWAGSDLPSSYDVASAKMGGNWRMPTQKEMKELRDNCDWTWTTTVNGEKGYLVKSKKNGYSIFLPAAGYREGTGLYKANEMGCYWSKSSDNRSYAYGMQFNVGELNVYQCSPYQGYSVRAVLP